MSDRSLQDLQEAIFDGRVLAIVGAGMSAFTSDNPLALWRGFLQDGLSRCVDRDPALGASNWHLTVEEQIEQGDFLIAADNLVEALGGQRSGEFASWLRLSSRRLKPVRPAAIHSLHAMGIPLATTNYDDLIEQVTGLDHLTWKATQSRMRDWACGSGHVLHVHGYWDDPEPIVMTTQSYERLARSRSLKQSLRSLAFRHTFLLVGFGAGVADPHFTSIRRWIRENYSGSGYGHFRLLPQAERGTAAELHRQDGDHIQVVGFAGDLAEGLRSLCADNIGIAIDQRVVVRPAGDADIERIYALDRAVFTQDDLIEPQILRAWQTTWDVLGGSVFWVSDCVSDPGAIDGYYGLLFLKVDVLERWKAGTIREDQFEGCDLCSPEEALSQREALIFSVVSATPPRSSGRRQLVRNLAERLQFYATRGNLESAYTCAATVAGSRSITHLVDAGLASHVQEAEFRADRHPIYRIGLTPEVFPYWNELMTRMR